MKELEALLAKKKKSGGDEELDPTYKSAKMGVLKEIRDMAAKDAGDQLGSLKKVTVAAPDKESLAKGLDKAKELMGDQDSEDESQEDPAEEASESPAEEAKEEKLEQELSDEKMSPEEIDELIQMLEKKKAALSSEQK